MPGKDRAFHSTDVHEMRNAIARVVTATTVTDMHTHLYPPAFGDLLLWGIDDLLTYHYLVAEVLRVSAIPYERFWALGKKEQADLVWRELFVERSPCSESCRGVLTVLNALGLDVSVRDLDAYRKYFAEQDPAAHVDTVFRRA
ncbi:MAG TPA: glucuronate isomerase, partial [Candidatus Hydrogenedentes bacterium]|nr:glucuronate isomerase [Candidatus Hydrogenedentota bacterium]